MTDTKWKKGQSGNPNGRPKGSKNKSNAAEKLKKALENGKDLKELKELGSILLKNEDKSLSGSQIKDIFKILVELEVELLKLDFKHEEEGEEELDEENEEKSSKSSPLSLTKVK